MDVYIAADLEERAFSEAKISYLFSDQCMSRKVIPFLSVVTSEICIFF